MRHTYNTEEERLALINDLLDQLAELNRLTKITKSFYESQFGMSLVRTSYGFISEADYNRKHAYKKES